MTKANKKGLYNNMYGNIVNQNQLEHQEEFLSDDAGGEGDNIYEVPEQSNDIGKIFCIGDSLNYLKFDIA